MRKYIFVLLVLVLSLGTASRALAGDVAANGLFFGAGSGALIGQAIGRNTDSTLLGAAVGGVLGYIVGNEQEKAYYYGRGPNYYYRYPGPVVRERRVVRRPTVVYREAPPVVYEPVPFFDLNFGWIFHNDHRGRRGHDYSWNRPHRGWRGHDRGWTRHHRGWRDDDRGWTGHHRGWRGDHRRHR